MPGCVFHVRGEDFAVDEFLTTSSLKPYQVWHKGDVLNRKGEECDGSGFSMDVSDVDAELSGQTADAIAFLRRHETELARLAQFARATDRRLDFGYDRRTVAVQCDYLPPELLALAGGLGIGIELSLYDPSESPAQ